MGNVIVRCAGIVIKNNKILLVKSDYDNKIYWILPGGGLCHGESLKECVKREVFEETGIKVKVGKLIFIDENCSQKNPMIHFTYLCKPQNDDLIIGSDPDHKGGVIKDVKYFDISAILKMDNFTPKIMRRYLLTAFKNKFNQGVINLYKEEDNAWNSSAPS